MPTVNRLTHRGIAEIALSFFNGYHLPKLINGASATKIEIDDLSSKREFLLSQKYLDRVYDNLDAYRGAGDVIYDTHYMEVPLQVAKYAISKLQNVEDTANEIVYEFGPPSEEYVLYLVEHLNSQGAHALDQFHNGYWFASEISGNCSSILQFIAETSDFVTLKIKSRKSRSYTKFVEFALSIGYEVAYNLRAKCLPTFRLNEYFSEPTLKSRNRDVADTSFPKRKYKTQLLEHYSNALVGQNPAASFLSFYNIIEFFYNSSIIEEGIGKIRGMITRTGFSVRNDDHIRELLFNITKTYNIEGENTLKGIREADSLKITLTRYVPLNDLVQKLSKEEYDYFSSEAVLFSGGGPIDFSAPDEFYSTLSQRIYSTRNSVVHSKEDSQKKYSPSRDRNILMKELNLMRAVAEVIIENTSEEMGF